MPITVDPDRLAEVLWKGRELMDDTCEVLEEMVRECERIETEAAK